jgi:hypothetical protein
MDRHLIARLTTIIKKFKIIFVITNFLFLSHDGKKKNGKVNKNDSTENGKKTTQRSSSASKSPEPKRPKSD